MTGGMDIRAFNRELIAAFRESGGIGEMGPVTFERLVLLTTKGRRSGVDRVTPLGYAHADGGGLLLFASNNGAPTAPDWFFNVEADPAVTVEITGGSWAATARILQGDERDRAYAQWLTELPATAHHQEKAGRIIPMVEVPRP